MNKTDKIKAPLNSFKKELGLRIDVCKSDRQQFNDSQTETEILGILDDDDDYEQGIFEELYCTTPTKSKHTRTNITEGNFPIKI